MGAKPKTVSLTDDTFLIASKIERQYHSGFSGWLRAMIRQWNESHDPVKTEIRLRCLSQAVGEHDEQSEIFNRSRELREQATLGDFE